MPNADKTEYIVLCGQVVGSGPFTTEYGFDGQRFSDRDAAVSHGLKIRGSDDFNVGVIVDGKLSSLDWMDQVVDTDPVLLAQIAEQVRIQF